GVAWEGRALARPLHRAGARRSREFYVFGKLGVLGSGESGVAWEGRALARPRHRAGARRSREFYVFGKLGVLGSGESGVAWEERALARPLHRAGARRSQETRPGSSTLPGGSVSVKQSEGHAAPDRALGLLLFPLGCADVLGQGAAGILVLLLHLPLHLCLAVHRRRGQC